MRKQNFKSDFDLTLVLSDSDGADLGFPDVNWELVLYTTSRQLAYIASYQYGEKTNVYNDESKPHVVIDRHEFPVGELLYEFIAEIPDESFPDGSRKVVTAGTTDIEIVNDRGQTLSGVTLAITVPHLKKKVDPES